MTDHSFFVFVESRLIYAIDMFLKLGLHGESGLSGWDLCFKKALLGVLNQTDLLRIFRVDVAFSPCLVSFSARLSRPLSAAKTWVFLDFQE
jgi:hypothetical protein